MNKRRWEEWWFLAGGGIHAAFKYRKWTRLKELATELPKLAWQEQDKEIERLKGLVIEAEELFSRYQMDCDEAKQPGPISDWVKKAVS